MPKGRFTHSMDDKGRIAIPQVYRVELQAEQHPPVLTRCLDVSAIAVHTHAHWTAFEERLRALSQVQPEAQRARRLLLTNAEECPLDAQGRLRVPQHLREYAGLDRLCVLAGVGAQIEIWDEARFESELTNIRDNGEAVSRVVAELGF